MSANERPPLWRALHDALLDSTGTCESSLLGEVIELPEGADWSGVIRAVADAIPEEFYGANGVRAWLLGEARKAEAGEQ